ncbi:MAG: hypothetical protein ABR601_09435 [Parasphingopyxis sp.]
MGGPMFEELDYRDTPIGALSLRRRRRSAEGEDIYEIRLDDGYLMTSLFTEGEIALAELGLAGLDGTELSVVVGGLGLGYTAKAALDHGNVGRLVTVEAIPEVIEWHSAGLLPLGEALASDPRCRFVHGDFFELAAGDGSFEPDRPGEIYDAVLVDIDNSPRDLLDPGNASFYEPAGLLGLAAKLKEGGVFALWSTDPPDDTFLAALETAFTDVTAELVRFDNPYREAEASNTIYLARRR